jgi:prepilin-type N-terminal cleavage/methylation domain-containing protein
MKRSGLTVVEVMIAIVIIGILLAVLTPAIIQSMRQTSRTGRQTQAVQIINYLGRRLVSNDAAVKPNSNEAITWDYQELDAAFNSDLNNDSTEGLGDPDNYRATITDLGAITWLGATANKYTIEVCFQPGADEQCIQTTTIAAPPTSSTSTSASYSGMN